MGDLTLERIQTNLLTCIQDMDDVLDYCLGLLRNNNVIVLIEQTLYHEFKRGCEQLAKVRTELYNQYFNLENKISLNILNLTLEGYGWIEYINDVLTLIEKKWDAGDINVDKYLLAQSITSLGLGENIILDVDDLELVIQSPHSWICSYVVKEGDLKICHCSAWKTKQEALIFALQMPGCGRENVYNRFASTAKK